VRRKIDEAVDLSKLHGQEEVCRALGTCANAGRFADGDLAAILAHQQSGTVIALPARASEERSLQRSTRLGGVRAMTVYYSDIRVLIDPEHSDPLSDGGRLQDLSVILTDRHGGSETLARRRSRCCPARRASWRSACSSWPSTPTA